MRACDAMNEDSGNRLCLPVAGSSYLVEPYNDALKSLWDEKVRSSRNATFLFLRDYMEYHKNRFDDASLIVKNRRGEIVALWVASRCDGVVKAHGGLTYGGLVLPRNGINAADVLEIMTAIADYWRNSGVKELVYKCVPWIYHLMPSQEDEYALFRLGARVSEVNISSVIDLQSDLSKIDSNVKRMRAKALKQGLVVTENEDFADYWQLLETLLKERYDAEPVHTLAEITRLARLMNGRIILHEVRDNEGVLLGGAVIYLTDMVAHAQYIAASPEGKDVGALHLLFCELMKIYRGRVRYFDFGTSNEAHGQYLNSGLIRWKRAFGATGVSYTTFSLEL